jgi:hypothetical protein
VLACRAVNAGFLWVLAVLTLLASWYWESLWPMVFATGYVALHTLELARTATQRSSLLWALTQPSRPMRMHWSVSVILTDHSGRARRAAC